MTQVLLAGRNTLFIEGLRALFEREPDLRVVGLTGVRQAGYSAALLEAEIVVADLLVQALGGPAIIAQIHKQARDAKIVVLSISTEAPYVSKVLAAGASGYVLKSESLDGLAHAVRVVVEGSRYLSPQLDARAVEACQTSRSSFTPTSSIR